MIFSLTIGRRCPLSLTEYYDYRYQLEDMLRDRLVNGIKHESIQHHLLSEVDSLKFQRAIDIEWNQRSMESVHSMESAIHRSSSMMRWAYSSNPEKEIYKITTSNPNLRSYWCTGRRKWYDYPFKSKECYICCKKGHIK